MLDALEERLKEISWLQALEHFVRSQPILIWVAAILWIMCGLRAIYVSLSFKKEDRIHWLALGVLNLIFGLEMTYPTRFQIAELFRAALRNLQNGFLYHNRRPLQAAILLGVILISLAVIFGLWRVFRKNSLSLNLTVIGTAISAIGYLLEFVSLHQLDSFQSVYWALWYLGILVTVSGLGSVLFSQSHVAPSSVTGMPGSSRSHQKLWWASLYQRINHTRLLPISKRWSSFLRDLGRLPIGKRQAQVNTWPALQWGLFRVGILLSLLALPELIGWIW